MKKIFGILIILLIIQTAFAGFVTAKELANMSKDENVVIVSARPPADYASKHVKGAVNIDHNTLYKEEGVKSMLKSPARRAPQAPLMNGMPPKDKTGVTSSPAIICRSLRMDGSMP